MRILILRSRRYTGGQEKDDYTQRFGGVYAEKVIGNLIGEEGFCASCGPDCTACRKAYDRGFRDNIAGVISLPGVLPYLLEKPETHVPRDVPKHEILLAVNVHSFHVDPLGGLAGVNGLREQRVNDLDEPFSADPLGQFGSGTSYKDAQPRTRVDQPFPLELRKNAGHRVGVDHQRAGKLTDRGKAIVGLELAPGDGLADLVA